MSQKVFTNFNYEVKEKGDRVLSFLGSTGDKDRSNEVIDPSGWRLGNYKRNPIFLFGHQYHSLPIGRAISVEKTSRGLEFDIEFAPKESYEFADTCFRLYKGKFLRAVSVGFLPIRWVDGDPTGEDKSITRTHLEQELLELSAVCVPANASALLQAASMKTISRTELEHMSERLNDNMGEILAEDAARRLAVAEMLCEAEAIIASINRHRNSNYERPVSSGGIVVTRW